MIPSAEEGYGERLLVNMPMRPIVKFLVEQKPGYADHDNGGQRYIEPGKLSHQMLASFDAVNYNTRCKQNNGDSHSADQLCFGPGFARDNTDNKDSKTDLAAVVKHFCRVVSDSGLQFHVGHSTV